MHALAAGLHCLDGVVAMKCTAIFLTALALLCLALPGSADEPAQPTMLYPNTTFALPAQSKVSVHWIIPPLDAVQVKEHYSSELYGFDAFFTVDGTGQPWVHSREILLNLLKGYKIHLPIGYSDFCCTENGAMFLAGDGELAIPVIPPALQTSYDGLPEWIAQPLTALPFPDGNVVAGNGDALYYVGRNPASEKWEVSVLSPEPSAHGVGKHMLRGFRTVLSSRAEITAVGGDGTTTYVASKRRLLKIADGKVMPVAGAFRAEDTVLQLAYSAKAGLYYATSRGVGYLGGNGQLEFLATPYPQLTLRGDDLYVLFTSTLGVVKISGVSAFPALPLAVKSLAAADSTAVKVPPLTFFEAGKELPDAAERQFATTFTRASARFIYGHLKVENLRFGKQDAADHQHVIDMQLYDANGELVTVDPVSYTFKPDEQYVDVSNGFGNEEPYTWYPGAYTVKVLLDGLQVDAKQFTITGTPILAEAVARLDAPMVEQLLHDKADPNTRNAEETPVLVAAMQRLSPDVQSSVTRIVRALVAAGADVNAADAAGNTALMSALTPPLAALLLDHGAKCDAVTTEDGRTPLHHIARYSGSAGVQTEQVMKLLLEHGAVVDTRDKEGCTPLRELVALYGSAAGIKLLLSHGADIDAADNEGRTPLCYLVSYRSDPTEARVAMIRLLLERHASVKLPQEPDKPVSSLLYEALTSCAYGNVGNTEVVHLLCDNGAWLSPAEEHLVVTMEYLQYLPAGAVRRLFEQDAVLRETADSTSIKPGWLPLLITALQSRGRTLVTQATSADEYQGAWWYFNKAITLVYQHNLTAQFPEVYLNGSLLARAMGNTADADAYLTRYRELVKEKSGGKP